MSLGTQVHGGFGFAAVDDVLADPYPGDLDLATVRLPSVPRVRSAEDDEAHHRAYWRAHVWAALHVYRRAFEDPVCPPWLRAEYARVAGDARTLVDRATGTYPISPLDSVACHAALKDLVSGARSLEQTVEALHDAPEVRPTDPPVALVDRRVEDAPDLGPAVEAGPDEPGTPESTGVHGPDFFAPIATGRSFDFKLSLRGARGLKRGRALGGGPPTEEPPPA